MVIVSNSEKKFNNCIRFNTFFYDGFGEFINRQNKNMQNVFQPQIILLREGTDTSLGKAQIVSNINACQAVAETLR